MTRRVGCLMLAGAIDSVGLAFGWTVFNLVAVHREGLAVTAVLNVAMFCGIALAAPAAGWLTARFPGRHVLQSTALAEALLRVWSLAMLYWHAPLVALFAAVLLMNVTGWVGFAAMRCEIAAAGGGPVGMTRYLAMTVALEAAGASAAALLPITSAGGVSRTWLAITLVGYAVSLLPTMAVASGSRVAVRSVVPPGAVDVQRRRILVAGAALMLVGSGPTMLYVALAARLHGDASVAGAAIAFAAGSLLSPAVTRLLRRTTSAGSLRSWPYWCAGMVLGWVAAPWSVAGLWLAQLLSGLCLTGFQGVMDHALTAGADDGRATTSLAQGSAARAVGTAAAVRVVPVFAAPVPLAAFAAVSAGVGLALAAFLARVLAPPASDEPVLATPEVARAAAPGDAPALAQ